jgi:surface carbohydrate biosynthesis protein
LSAWRPTLVVPVESQVRELDAKLLLSCVAAERGFSVVLGSRAFVHFAVARLPRGVYLAKSMRKLSDKMFSILRDLGHEIAAFDEEALVRFANPEYHRRRLSAEAMGRVAVLMAWGEDDAQAFREFEGYHGAPIHVTGNPRMDLLRDELRPVFKEEADALRARFGELVLVNTNFGAVNAFVPSLNVMQPAGRDPSQLRPGANALGFSAEFAAGLALHKRTIFEAFQSLLPALCDALPDHTIVLRPHPSEDHEPWRRAIGARRNAVVVHEGSVIPWLMAAKALVHNGCTTAVEAAVVGTPSVAYQPVTSERFDFHLPNALSERAFDVSEVARLVRAAVSGSLPVRDEEERRRVLERHVAALEGPLAADRMVDVLVGAGFAAAPPPAPSWARHARGSLRTGLRTAKKRRNMRNADHRNSAEFHRHRFPGVTVASLEARIRRFGRQLGRFQQVRVLPLSEHVFRVEA